jgi:uncharacterized protein (DUF924 family)
MNDAEDILNFWFFEIGRDKWFEHEEALDSQIRDRFLPDYEKAVHGELKKWEETPEGTLALLLLLDEFPQRMFRNTARAFETGEMAVELAREGIIKHFDDRIDRQYKLLFYLPFLNSENVGDQRLALFYIRERVKDSEWLAKAEENHEIVLRYGRFPQRDAILGRHPDLEEQE